MPLTIQKEIMNKPLLAVVTGKPACGKTTLAHILAKEIRCPLLSRDEFKEGYINTVKLDHDHLPANIALSIYETFFEVIDLMISKKISIIIEAAFQHKLWEPKLSTCLNKADVRIVICETSKEIARARFFKRTSDDKGREKFHGDKLSEISQSIGEQLIESYEAPQIPVPTMYVNTTDEYVPGIDTICDFLRN
jgi:adenylate kinase family enzyme